MSDSDFARPTDTSEDVSSETTMRTPASDPSRASSCRGRRGTYVLLAGLVLLGLGAGQWWNGRRPLPNGPSVVLSDDVAHFSREPMVILSHDRSVQNVRVSLYNPWPVPIDIESIQASCACSTPRVRKRHVLPNEAIDLEMDVDLPFSGTARPLQLTITTRQEKHILVSLVIYAMRHIHIESSSPGVLAFGEIDRLSEVRRSWRLFATERVASGDDIEILRVDSEEDGVEFRLRPVVDSNASESLLPLSAGTRSREFELIGIVRGDSRVGFHSVPVDVVYRQGDEEHECRLFATWSVRQSLSVEPRRVVWKLERARREVSAKLAATVAVVAEDGRPFRVRSVEPEFPWIEARLESTGPGKRQIVRLVLRDAKGAEKYGFQEIRIATDHPRQPVVRIPVTVLPSPLQ